MSRPIRFPERTVAPFIEPVSSARLDVGSVYFAVSYLDKDLLIPTVMTLVLVEVRPEGSQPERFLFQDANSYWQGIRAGSDAAPEHAIFIECREGQLNNLFEFEKALEDLMRCSLRRRTAAPADLDPKP